MNKGNSPCSNTSKNISFACQDNCDCNTTPCASITLPFLYAKTGPLLEWKVICDESWVMLAIP